MALAGLGTTIDVTHLVSSMALWVGRCLVEGVIGLASWGPCKLPFGAYADISRLSVGDEAGPQAGKPRAQMSFVHSGIRTTALFGFALVLAVVSILHIHLK